MSPMSVHAGAQADRLGAPTASVVVLSAQARRVPSPEREAFAARLAELEPNEAMIVVHTCHRVEVYLSAGSFGEVPLPEPPAGIQRLSGDDAARHLASVACGLDSAVLGENQILHQLRETLNERRASHPLEPALDRLFQISLHAGRRARSWFNGSQRSLADVALERIAERSGDLEALEGRPVLVVGAGIMGRLAAQAAARQGAKVVVTSRTDERAVALAREVSGCTIPFGGDEELERLAGAIVALGGRWPLGEEGSRRLLAGDATVVDMSSPPALAEWIQDRLGERLVSNDDLAWAVQTDMRDGLRNRLEGLVEEACANYSHWLHSRQALTAIQAIGEAADERRRRELDWLLRRLPNLAEDERSLIEQMSHRLVAGILHEPRSALKSDQDGDLEWAARELFGA